MLLFHPEAACEMVPLEEKLKPNEPEYARRAVPPVLYLCSRCKRGLLVFLGVGDEPIYEPSIARPHAWCYTCSSKNSGIKYVLGVRGADDGGAPLQAEVSTVRADEGLQRPVEVSPIKAMYAAMDRFFTDFRGFLR
jgi:hypothetical protein